MTSTEKEETIHILSDILAECLEKEVAVSEKTDLIADLELDSIDIFRVIVKVEEFFGIEFDDMDLLSENFTDIGSFCELIQGQISKEDTNHVSEKESEGIISG